MVMWLSSNRWEINGIIMNNFQEVSFCREGMSLLSLLSYFLLVECWLDGWHLNNHFGPQDAYREWWGNDIQGAWSWCHDGLSQPWTSTSTVRMTSTPEGRQNRALERAWSFLTLQSDYINRGTRAGNTHLSQLSQFYFEFLVPSQPNSKGNS